MGILSGNPKKEPLHYGEVYGIWMNLSASKAAYDAHQVFLNHTGDEDLRKFLKHIIDTTILPEIEALEGLLVHNDVAVPPTPAERPAADLEQIPVGARLQDAQIANGVAKEIGGCLVAYSTMIGQAIREDVAVMFGGFHAKKMKDGAQLLQMLKDKGWLMPPPLHHETKQGE